MRVRINEKEYAWGDIGVYALGRFITNITAINYKTKKVKERRYGAGREARSIQHGRRECEGDWNISQSEVDALNRAAREAGYKDFLDLDLDIVVSYIPEFGVAVTTDHIQCASFSEIPKGMKEGDLQSEHSMPFVCLNIDYDTSNPY